jgi:voltage-gated potassium channel
MTRQQLHARLDFGLTLLALLVLPALLLEAFTTDPLWLDAANKLDWAIWIGFALILVALFFVERDRRRFWRGHAFDLLIVVLTPPIAPDLLQSFRALRALRLVRLLLAGMRLHRFARGLTRASVVGPAAVVLAVIIVGSATVVNQIEPGVPSIIDALWWSISRVTALGDGGIVLTEPVSRALELVVVLSGLAFLSLITAAIATIFVRAEEAADPELEKLDAIVARLDRIEARLNERGDGA